MNYQKHSTFLQVLLKTTYTNLTEFNIFKPLQTSAFCEAIFSHYGETGPHRSGVFRLLDVYGEDAQAPHVPCFPQETDELVPPASALEVGFVPAALPRDRPSPGWGIPRPDSALRRCRVLWDSPSPRPHFLPHFGFSSIPEPALGGNTWSDLNFELPVSGGAV